MYHDQGIVCKDAYQEGKVVPLSGKSYMYLSMNDKTFLVLN